MKIVYGVHGYGRGHAMRAMAVLPELMRRHDVRILAGGDAYRALSPTFPVTRIPMIAYKQNRRGRIATWRTLKHNLPIILDVLLGGPGIDMVTQAVEEFGPDVILTDSEIHAHWVARRLGVPRITFDHFGVLVYCELPARGFDRVRRWAQARTYRLMFGEADRLVVSAFFNAPVRRDGVKVVGPVIRPEVREQEPTRGEHLLAYISMGQHEFTLQIERALAGLDCPVRIYGVPREGVVGSLEFRPIDNRAFIRDMSGARGIFATAGNQLLGEAIYLGKPVLAMPIDCFEQRLNADAIAQMGLGMRVDRANVTVETLREFLDREEEFRANAGRHEKRLGEAEAVEAIERFAAELTAAPAS